MVRFLKEGIMNNNNSRYFLLYLSGLAILMGVIILLQGSKDGFLFVLGGGVAAYFSYKSIENNKKTIESNKEQLAKIKDYRYSKISKFNNEIKSTKESLKGKNLHQGNFKSGISVYLCLDGENLLIFPSEASDFDEHSKLEAFDYFEISIPVTGIRYYLQTGEVIAKVGGYGGGSAYSFVTGWNGKVNPISISTQVEDNKRTDIYYSINNDENIISFSYEDFHILKRILPMYDYNNIQGQLVSEPVVFEGNIKVKLQKIEELRKEGLISEEEYKSKREEILRQI